MLFSAIPLKPPCPPFPLREALLSAFDARSTYPNPIQFDNNLDIFFTSCASVVRCFVGGNTFFRHFMPHMFSLFLRFALVFQRKIGLCLCFCVTITPHSQPPTHAHLSLRRKQVASHACFLTQNICCSLQFFVTLHSLKKHLIFVNFMS